MIRRMTAVPVERISYAEYLAREAASPTKHEYLRGEAWAMAGGTIEHARLQGAVIRELSLGLRGRPCVVLTSDARVRVDATDRTTYPDASVVCGPREASPVDRHALINPVVLVEVLSPETERDDRGEKFAHYRHLASLAEYVLVSQSERRIEVFRRAPEGWILTEAVAGESMHLRSIDVTLDVDAIYFDPAA
jgi:Uma2 family endonuclease